MKIRFEMILKLQKIKHLKMVFFLKNILHFLKVNALALFKISLKVNIFTPSLNNLRNKYF